MVELIRVALALSNVREENSDGTLKHEESFECGRQIVYKVKLCNVGGFPFHPSLLIVW
jgi:hypothetical protein